MVKIVYSHILLSCTSITFIFNAKIPLIVYGPLSSPCLPFGQTVVEAIFLLSTGAIEIVAVFRPSTSSKLAELSQSHVRTSNAAHFKPIEYQIESTLEIFPLTRQGYNTQSVSRRRHLS
ncbi:uncharacterized protein F4822DRAFT_78141 [Hypoxylon trugodes]|uniref:uncharacterized protein n=1 Tax=Hypoxylon trugodes TaxID=326681 RepID=UPI00219319DB|nr:uncharacterized protein F4822DRAFT_78141 [Hypoxylon trugodes]KAI1383448.1 hypothetical protein F4822DRAFT_78141 [Hypoxylon trugodes]